MELSIIVPYYNVESYISHCIESLLNQDLSSNDYEIILINDGSTDNSGAIAARFANRNNNVKLIEQNNSGISVARNNGVVAATGKYIYFVDSDDYVSSDSFKNLTTFSIIHDLDILEFGFTRTKSRDLHLSKHTNINWEDLNVLSGSDYISSRNFIDCVWVYFYKREFLINSKIKFIEGRMMEDTFFNAELIPKARKIAYYPLDVYRYVINPNSVTTSKNLNIYRKVTNDHVFMVIKFSEVISVLKAKGIDVKLLKIKQQEVLFKIFKRLLLSNLKFGEIKSILSYLSEHDLYPLKQGKSHDTFTKIMISIFNTKNILFIAIYFYRIFKFPIDNLIIKRYQNRKEKQQNNQLKKALKT